MSPGLVSESDAEAGLAPVLRAARCGQLRQAARLAEAAARRTAPQDRAALPLANIRGGIAFELGQLDAAEACFEEALRLAAEWQDPDFAARATTNLGSVAHLRGKAELAASLYRSALQRHRLGQNRLGEAQAEHNLNLVERARGRLGEAEAHGHRAVAAARLAEDPALLGLTLAGAAETAMARQQFGQARRFLAEARALARGSGDELGLLEIERLRALLSFHLARYEVAVLRARRAYLSAGRLGGLYLAGECAALCARASRRLKRPRMAAAYRLRARRCLTAAGADIALQRLSRDSR